MVIDKEEKVKRLNRRINDYQKEINELKEDFPFLKGKRAMELIDTEIKNLERFKERKEFELWKLESGGE